MTGKGGAVGLERPGVVSCVCSLCANVAQTATLLSVMCICVRARACACVWVCMCGCVHACVCIGS